MSSQIILKPANDICFRQIKVPRITIGLILSLGVKYSSCGLIFDANYCESAMGQVT